MTAIKTIDDLISSLSAINESLEKAYELFRKDNKDYLTGSPREHAIYLYAKIVAYSKALDLAKELKANMETKND